MGVLRLFRGDSSVIDEFNVKKTSKYGLLGQGIYLTNSLKIAKTYKSKGLSSGMNGELFAGHAKDRADAYSKAKPLFFKVYCRLNQLDSYDELKNKKVIDAANRVFETLIADKVITSKYINCTGNVPYLIVTLDQAYIDAGDISTFDFDQDEFESKIIKVDGCVNNEQFWKTMWKHQIPMGVQGCASEDQFVQMSSRLNINLMNIKCKPILQLKGKTKVKTADILFDSIRKAMMPQGFLGMEYEGGRYMGGGGHHRAFCLWDHHFVNRHRLT